jgi:hypothetical protein
MNGTEQEVLEPTALAVREELVPHCSFSGIEFSPTLAAIAKALLIAQGNMDEVFKSSTNPHFRSKYADLPSCINAVKPALQAAGIALLQAATSNADASVVFVETMFLHESGEWVRSRLGLRPVKTDPQGAGSAITYGRRYTVLAMCGVAPEEDDDGNRASGRAITSVEPPSRPAPRPQPAAPPRKPPVPPPAPPAHPEPELPPAGKPPPPTERPPVPPPGPNALPPEPVGPTPAQRKQLFALAAELGMDEKRRHDFGDAQFRKPSSKTWTKDEVSRAIDVLSRRLDARNQAVADAQAGP